jgi:hypothetical protein
MSTSCVPARYAERTLETVGEAAEAPSAVSKSIAVRTKNVFSFIFMLSQICFDSHPKLKWARTQRTPDRGMRSALPKSTPRRAGFP